MERSAAPGEDEQFEEYEAIALTVGADRPLIIRTPDVGGDKLPNRVVHLLAGLNAGQYAAEMRGQLAG